MTQRILKTTIGAQAATVLMGWDKPLQYHFMVIEYLNGDDEPLYRGSLRIRIFAHASG